MERQGSGGAAPSKLKSSAEGRFANEVREPCRRHGLKLVYILREEGAWESQKRNCLFGLIRTIKYPKMVISYGSIGLIKFPKNGFQVSCPREWLEPQNLGSCLLLFVPPKSAPCPIIWMPFCPPPKALPSFKPSLNWPNGMVNYPKIEGENGMGKTPY